MYYIGVDGDKVKPLCEECQELLNKANDSPYHSNAQLVAYSLNRHLFSEHGYWYSVDKE